MAIKRLTQTEVQQKIGELPGWELANDKLHREFKFDNFVEAFGFMSQAALVSERMDHHPEWFNVYNRVVIDLTTHACGGISERDVEWARKISGLYASRTDCSSSKKN